MFHVEVRQFPHVARTFNLSRQELDTRIVLPWVSNAPIELDDRRWAPERARLTIYEGRELRPDELGVGRGWPNVTRTGEEVTARLLEESASGPQSPSSIEAFKRDTLRLCAAQGVSLGEVVVLASDRHPGWRLSERLALVEQAVWELLHHGQLRMSRPGGVVDRADWQSVLFRWSEWTGAQADPAFLETVRETTTAAGPAGPAGPQGPQSD